ncbi:MAG: ABC transporter ATP-binding protein [Phycisphaerae bacterium]
MESQSADGVFAGRFGGTTALESPKPTLSIISITNLTKRYGRRVGVNHLTLHVPAGQVFGFLGPNGAGKTTTIRVLLGLLRPSMGRAQVLGLDCWSSSHRIKADLGYLPGDLRLYSWLNLHRALTIASQVRHCDLSAAGHQLAELFDLEPDLRVRSMSRGNRQKLGLILALVHRPKILVLDEPTSGLDPIMQERLKHHLRGLAAEGHSIFFSSHSLAEVQHICDRVAILRRGTLVADESLEALRARAGRQVTLTWADCAGPAKPSPDFLEVFEEEATTWHCTLTGKVPDLLSWLADKPVADLTLGQPDLETLFRRYYDDQEVTP